MNPSNLKKLFHIMKYRHYMRRLWWSIVLPVKIRLVGVSVGRKVRFFGSPIISMFNHSSISIGEHSVLCSVSEMTPLGVNHPVVLRTLAPSATVAIGKYTGISGGSICARARVEIGDRCLIGANVTIADTDFHALSPEGRYDDRNIEEVATSPVILEDDVFIGTNVVILKGVRIGRNSVIGAGSVVTKSVPMNSIAAGNPARVLRGVNDSI